MSKLLKIENDLQQHGGGNFTFYCPGCKIHHSIWTSESRVKHPVWEFNGNVDSPTFRPSILVTFPGHICHSYVTDGKIQYLTDCTHELAGQTIDLPDMEDEQ
jgi:hypothetical protein